eukprot:g29851.t1
MEHGRRYEELRLRWHLVQHAGIFFVGRACGRSAAAAMRATRPCGFWPTVLRCHSNLDTCCGSGFLGPRCAARFRVLWCGIDGSHRRNTRAELRGCINDVNNMQKVLVEQYGFKVEDILMINEDLDKSKWPYKKVILGGMEWLYKGALDRQNW